MKRIIPYLFWISLLAGLTLSLQNCKKSEPDPVKPGGSTNPGSSTTTPGSSTTVTTTTTPGVSTVAAPTTSGISSTSATVSAVVEGNGGAAISQHGFVYSKTAQTPTLTDSKTEKGATSGPFPLTISSNLTGLDPNTTYYVRAYATNDKGTGYGSVAQVKTTTSVVPLTVIEPVDYLMPYGFKANAHLSAIGPNPLLVNEIGFVYSETNATPTLDVQGVTVYKKQAGLSASYTLPSYGVPYSNIYSELNPGQTFYLRAFVTYKEGTEIKVNYSEVLTVKLPTVSGQTGSWKEIGTYSQAGFSQFTTVGNKHYWVTGSNTLEVDQLTAATTRKANFPGTSTTDIRQVAIGQKVYLVGGQKNTSSPVETWEYDVATNTWKQRTNFPGLARSGALITTAGGKLYYGIGNALTNPNYNYYKDWWEYNPDTDQWTKKADYLLESTRNVATEINGKIYLLAGIENGSGSGSTTSYSRKVFMYEPASNSWKQLKDGPTGEDKLRLRFMSRQALNNKLFVLQTNLIYTQLWEYDGQADTWTPRRDLIKKALDAPGPYLYINSGKLYVLAYQDESTTPIKLLEFTP